MFAYLRLRVVSASARGGAECPQNANKTLENIDEHWDAIKNAFVSHADEVVNYIIKGRYKTWLIAETKTQVDIAMS